ncbi:PQQ-binding-like beta-propeller repeat protein [Aquihabitans sp. McL0605]|uniref:outer membrane protein assembly factor BamB family protein n=1 Tax=Aquihabitans sp. McL0605 TaxID=3415671 RepID=UPI003CF0506E
MPSRTVGALAAASRADRRQSARTREIQRNRLIAGGGILVVLVLVLWGCSKIGGSDDSSSTAAGGSKTTEPSKTEVSAAKAKGIATASTYKGWVDPKSSGEPWSSKVVGQLTFRGNPTRSYYGLGPLPKAPKVLWRYPKSGGMCSSSPVGNTPHSWCGSGWTGEPAVWEQDGKTLIAVGTYDQHIHFINAADGTDWLDPFDMHDIIKGSVTKDPEGEPILYSGSRADFHILGLDRPTAAADLWSMSADNVTPVNGWNDDWDSSPLMIDDYLFEGGENGQWYIIKLNRSKGADGMVTVDPKIVFHAPGWDDQLTSDLAGSGARVKDNSIENSLAISGNTVYFANSGGLVQGWDITNLKKDPNSVKRIFRYWTGDDTDASVVVDKEGMLYVASERERTSSFARDDEAGQLMKLDPSKPDDPLVWKVNDPEGGGPSGTCTEASCYGIWGTPAIYNGVVYAGTNHGRFLGVSMKTGKILWEKKLPGPTWQSPVVVDKTLVMGDCSGVLHAYDVSDPNADPPELWNVDLEGCIESTPTVFKGKIYVGARGGAFYAIGDA